MLGALARELLGRPCTRVEPHPRRAVALETLLDPHEDLGVHRLRAGVATPQPPGDRGEQEQRAGRDHQHRGEKDEVLRIEHQCADVEAPRREVEQHQLAAVKREPGQAVEQRLGDHTSVQRQAAKRPLTARG